MKTSVFLFVILIFSLCFGGEREPACDIVETTISSSWNDFAAVEVYVKGWAEDVVAICYFYYDVEKYVNGQWVDADYRIFDEPNLPIYFRYWFDDYVAITDIVDDGNGNFRIRVGVIADYAMDETDWIQFTVNDITPPAAPSELSWTLTANNHPKISWTSEEIDVEDFMIQRAYGNIAPLQWSTLATGITNKYYEDTDVTISQGGQGPNYVNYRVKAYDHNNNASDFSDSLQIQYSIPHGDQRIDFTRLNSELVPAKVHLQTNYPNPFNPETTIGFYLPIDQKVKITIYSLTGEKVAILVNGFMKKGFHQIRWNGTNQTGSPVSSGIYIYELLTDNLRLTRKMLLAK